MAASGGSRSAAEAVQAPPAMASQAQATTAAPKQHPAPGNIDSRRVGNQFVQQYYVVLRKSPSHLFRFFKEDSIFSHQSLVKGDHEHEVVPARDEAVLQERINYLYPGEENVEIKVLNVESQPSSNGGVIVQVTGTLQLLRPDSGPRLFAQTFFLATQPHGYFVLNDILRYMEPLPVPIHPVAAAIPIPTIPPSLLPTAMGILAPAALPSENVPQATLPHQPSPAPASAQGLPFHGPPAMPDPSQGPQAPTEAVIQAQPQLGSILSDQPQGPAAPTAEAVENFESHPILPEEVAEAKVEMEFPEQPAADLEPQAAAAAKDPVPSAPSAPLTYAERVRLSLASKAAAAQAAQHPASAPSGPPLAAPVPAAPEGAPSLKDSKQPPPLENGSMPAVAVPAAAHPASLAQPQSSSPNASVFVRYLPAGVNEEVLAAELERFGPLQPSNMYPKGINIKTQGMRAYAFVDFCTPDAAAACIESGIMVNGKTVSVEEKRPNMARNGSRGGNIGGRDGRRDGGGRGGGRMDGRRESNRNYGGRDGQRVGNRGVADRERPGGKGTGRF